MKDYRHLLICLYCFCVAEIPAIGQEPVKREDLSVGIFMYLPNANSVIERLEKAFEESELGREVDVDFELFDPYQEPNDPSVVRNAIAKFDIVEIDLARLDDLLGDAPVIDPLPQGVVFPVDQFVSAAQDVAGCPQSQYFVPHLVCGQYFVFWRGNSALESAHSFEQILGALDHCNCRKLFADLAGSTTLGELYADAILDRKGEDIARRHFEDLHALENVTIENLDKDAVVALKRLFDELDPGLKQNVGFFHEYAHHYYPVEFAKDSCSAMIGYSERLYYVQQQLLMSNDTTKRELEKDEVVVRQFPFSSSSKGTPMWVDGFVIPKGKLDAKKDAIERFLRFSVQEKGYVPFVIPSEWSDKSSYLLPAHINGYSESLVRSQPNISQYRTAYANPFTIDSSSVWRGIRKAGKLIENELCK